MSVRSPSLATVVSTLVLIQLGLILLLVPVGKIYCYVGELFLSIGGNVYKIFPQLVISCGLFFFLRRQRPRWGVFAGPLTALAAIGLISAASSIHPTGSFREGLRLLFCAGFYVALVNLPWDETRFQKVLLCLPVGIWLLAIRVSVGWATGSELRAEGGHGHPNVLGTICVLLLPLLLFFGTFSRQRLLRVLLHATACVLGGVLILTFSRSAYLAVVAALAWLVVVGDRKVRKGLIPAALVTGIALILVWDTARDRWKETGLDLSAKRPESRLAIWDVTFEDALPELPLIGWGVDKGFAQMVEARERFRSDRIPHPRLAHPHNQILDILTGSGLPGLVGWTWLAVAFVLHLRNASNWPVKEAPVYLGAAAVGLAAMTPFEAVFISRNVFPTFVLILVLCEVLPKLSSRLIQTSLSRPGMPATEPLQPSPESMP